jgi:hypothetical protein
MYSTGDELLKCYRKVLKNNKNVKDNNQKTGKQHQHDLTSRAEERRLYLF